MKVVILYSGGKDSNLAVQFCKEKGWDIRYLLTIQPNRKDCYLFHYATVEYTPLQASLLGLPHYIVPCTVADPMLEAAIVKNFVLTHEPVDAVVLGGIGLQETQLRSIQQALLPYRVEVFAAHAGLDHDTLIEDMFNKGYEIMITQIASEGLKDWLGKKITKQNFAQLKKDAAKHGFHVGGEGGYYDTFVLDSPLFSKRIEFGAMEIVMEDQYSGHVIGKGVKILPKQRIL